MKVVLNSSRSEIVGWLETGLLKVKLVAPPEGGRANKELVGLLAQTFAVKKRNVVIVSGTTARLKGMQVRDLAQAELESRVDGVARLC